MPDLASLDPVPEPALPDGAGRPPAAVAAPALRLSGVSHAYGPEWAVREVDLEVSAGEIVCLVGASGCGKSTLLRIAAGLEVLQSGEVWSRKTLVAGSSRGVPPERRGVGLVFQDYALFPHLSVLDNVRFGLGGLGGAAQRERALAALGQVDMTPFAQTFPHTLSGGQQQRVALARAIAPRPRVVLLDEPFSGLDMRLRHQVRDDTLHVLKETGAATMVVTHDPEEAMFLGDRIAVMDRGRILQLGPPEEVFFRPNCAFVAGFLGEVNRLDAVASASRVETVFGPIPAPGQPDGAPVQVLIRPEALQLSPADGAGGGPTTPVGVVKAARLLGGTSLIHLSVEAPGGLWLHLHARLAGRALPAEGARVAIALDRSQCYVFAR